MKHALRQEMREKRNALSPVLYAEKSGAIQKKLEHLPQFKEAKKILIYISTPEEVDTHKLVQDALKQGRTVYVPKVNRENLVLCPLFKWEDLEPGAFGLLEPCQVLEPDHPSHMDLILVPGIAFDEQGHRIGYGKGFYDQLLKETQGYKVGLAFQEQILDEVPIEAHDVPVDLIVTDQALIYPTARSAASI